MSSILKRRRQKQAELIEEARKFVRSLPPELGRFTAWVYGSVARGDFNLWSDIDVLVVAEHFPQNPLERSELLYRHVVGGVEPKGWTKEEFERLLKKRDAQLLSMLKHRITLSDDFGLEERLRELEAVVVADAS